MIHFHRWNGRYQSCQPAPDQLQASLTVATPVELSSGHFCWPPVGTNYLPLTIVRGGDRLTDLLYYRATTNFWARFRCQDYAHDLLVDPPDHIFNVRPAALGPVVLLGRDESESGHLSVARGQKLMTIDSSGPISGSLADVTR